MKKTIIWFCSIGITFGILFFAWDKLVEYPETNSYDNCCMAVFNNSLFIHAAGGGILGASLGYIFHRLILFTWKISRKE